MLTANMIVSEQFACALSNGILSYPEASIITITSEGDQRPPITSAPFLDLLQASATLFDEA
jgi:hypothetical protein